MVKAEPTLLLPCGQFVGRPMRTGRVTEAGIRAAACAQGIGTFMEVEAVVLETDGRFTVLRHGGRGSASALTDVPRPPAAERV